MGQPSRRWFLAAASALFVSLPIRAQRGDKLPRIGFVSPTLPGPRNEAFLQGLRELGYVDGRNVHVEMRFAEGQPERLPQLVDELIRLKVDVLVAGATIGARAAKEATTTIPIVFAGSSDPVAAGIVTSLARPGGNVTGISLAYGTGVAGKWLEFLKETAPGISQCAALWSSSNPAAAAFVKDVQRAARVLKVRLDVHHASNPIELDQALGAIGSSGAQGLIVIPSPFAATHRDRLIRFAASKRLPAMYFVEDFTEAGGLMSYGPSIANAYRASARHVDKILKGAKPGELAVEQPTKFDLIVNMRTAKALEVDVPKSILVRVDRLID